MSDEKQCPEYEGFEAPIITDWDGWDGDHELLYFYNGILVRDIPGEPRLTKGTKIDSTCFVMPRSIVQFYLEDGSYVEFKFSLQLGELHGRGEE